jgi:pimeloyl-ACP methyl ester carboxylesterase
VPHLDGSDGVRLHVQELGPVGAPPVVMLHGLFTGNLAAWYFSAGPAVAKAGHRVRLVDLRGHGLSDRPATGYDEHSMVADAAAVTADLAPFAVVGHSYGALLALRLALAHPERVTSLVLVEPPLGPAGRDGKGSTAGATSARWRTWDDGPSDQVKALLDETSLLADLDAERPVADDELRAIAVPTLFLFGSESPWRDGAERVKAVRPDLPCTVLFGGHDLQLDAKAEVTEATVAHVLAAGGRAPSGPEEPDDDDEVAYG